MGKPTVESLYEQVRALSRTGSTAQDTTRPTLTQVAPGIRVLALRTPTLPPATHTNVYLIGPEGGPVAVVDPGSPYRDQLEILLHTLHSIGGVSVVLLTHHHGDHIGGATEVAGEFDVGIAAHASTAARLSTKLVIERQLADDEVVCGARCIFTPGHAEGHLCFEVGGATIAGDMVAGVGTILIDPDEGDMALYLASLEKLRARPQTTLLPAHGPAIPDGHAKLTEYLAHRRMREQRVVDALAGGGSVDELVGRAYADTPTALWPIAQRSLLAHLVKLQREDRAREEDGRWSL